MLRDRHSGEDSLVEHMGFEFGGDFSNGCVQPGCGGQPGLLRLDERWRNTVQVFQARLCQCCPKQVWDSRPPTSPCSHLLDSSLLRRCHRLSGFGAEATSERRPLPPGCC